MNYFGASINQTPTVAEQAGTPITNGEFLIVKYDDNGNVAVCDTEGELVAGVLLPETTKAVAVGEDVTVQVKDIGLVKTGTAVKKGQEVMTDNKGRAVPAAAGKFILGYAMQPAAAENEIISVQITKSGYKA